MIITPKKYPPIELEKSLYEEWWQYLFRQRKIETPEKEAEKAVERIFKALKETR